MKAIWFSATATILPKQKSSYRFERIRTLYYLMHQAVKGCAYRCNGSNLAFRKKMFIDGDGYKGNLQFMNGEYDFIVNKYSTPLRTGVVTSKDAIIIEDMPSKKTWINRNLSYLHLRCAMKHGKWLRFLLQCRCASVMGKLFLYHFVDCRFSSYP